MRKPSGVVLENEGRAARARAQDRAESGRISIEAWYPELEAFREREWRIAWIAQAVRLSDRRVSEVLRVGRERKRELLEIPVHVVVNLEDEACLEFTADGFELFFNRFSGRRLTWFAKEWVADFIANRNLLLNVPPRHAKSTIMSVWLPIWLLCIDRNEQILIVSKTRALAVKFCREIEYNLSFNEGLIRAFGRFAPDLVGETPWRAGQGELLVQGRARESKSGDLSIQSRGMEQQILGMEATVVIVDDPTDSATAQSEVKHAEEMRKLHEEVLSRIEPKTVSNAAGRAVVVMQRVHPEDVAADLQAEVWERGPLKGQPLWITKTMRAVLNWEEHETLWPEKFDWEEIELIYARVGGEQTFETMYQQNPAPVGTNSIRPEWLIGCRDENRPGGQGVRGPDNTIPISRVVSIDPSPTEWNAMVVADVVYAPGQGHWGVAVIEVRRWKGGPREFKAEVNRALRTYAPDHLIVEESSFFKWFTADPWYDLLSRQVNVVKQHTGVNKLDQELGADSLAGDFELGLVRLPYGDDEGRSMSQLLEHEALAWPLGRTFDTMMALWFVKWNRKRLRPRVRLMDHFFGSRKRVNSSHAQRAEGLKKQARRDRLDRMIGTR